MIFKVIHENFELKAYEVRARVKAVKGSKSVGYIESTQMLPTSSRGQALVQKLPLSAREESRNGIWA